MMTMICNGCGQPLAQTAQHRWTCSPACRKRVERRRKGVTSTEEVSVEGERCDIPPYEPTEPVPGLQVASPRSLSSAAVHITDAIAESDSEAPARLVARSTIAGASSSTTARRPRYGNWCWSAAPARTGRAGRLTVRSASDATPAKGDPREDHRADLFRTQANGPSIRRRWRSSRRCPRNAIASSPKRTDRDAVPSTTVRHGLSGDPTPHNPRRDRKHKGHHPVRGERTPDAGSRDTINIKLFSDSICVIGLVHAPATCHARAVHNP